MTLRERTRADGYWEGYLWRGSRAKGTSCPPVRAPSVRGHPQQRAAGQKAPGSIPLGSGGGVSTLEIDILQTLNQE